ncbi:MAG: FecR domain-containing protein [Longimicrobiales bacterium]
MSDRIWLSCLAAAVLLLLPGSARAQQPTVSPVSGTVEIQLPPDPAFRPLTEAGSYPGSAVVRTGPDGFAMVRYADGSEVVVRPGSEVRVGGEGGEGVMVRLGKVLLRIRRLMTPGQERTHRTPTTVAAVRGTEFGLAVEPSGRTRVFVFEGRVAVSNAESVGGTVEVDAGRMTDVDVRRPPSEPRSFAAGEFETGVSAGEVERGEDRAVEAGQAPVALRWLAFPDPDLDALANPAYLADGPSSGVSAVAFGELAEGGDRVEQGGRSTRVTDDAVRRGVGLAMGRASVGSITLAAFAQGDAGLDRAERTVRAPGSTLADVFAQEARWRVGEGRVLGAWAPGPTSLGVEVGHRRASLDAESAPAGVPGKPDLSEARSDITSLSLGIRRRGKWTSGLSVHHSMINSTTDAAEHAELSQSRTALEALARRQGGRGAVAGWLRLERTSGSEDRTVAGQGLLYREELAINTVRIGFGAGFTPAAGTVLSVDLAAGLADESAVQTDAAGRLLEDEEDLRLSGSAHLGAQVAVAGPWHIELSVLHSLEHIDRDFVLGREAGGSLVDVRSVFGSRASAGLLYGGRGWTGRYAISASPEGGRPWIHSLLVAVTPR